MSLYAKACHLSNKLLPMVELFAAWLRLKEALSFSWAQDIWIGGDSQTVVNHHQPQILANIPAYMRFKSFCVGLH